jgi:4-diphosphocytidyl-2C-methyl-D-erythritol kinase
MICSQLPRPCIPPLLPLLNGSASGQFSPAYMSGAGSCIFSIFDSLEKVDSVLTVYSHNLGVCHFQEKNLG